MLFLINVILNLWVSFAGGQVKTCDLPQIKHGYLYEGLFSRPSFPAPIGKAYYYYCNKNFVTPTRQGGDYMTCTQQGWSPAVPCLRQCYLYSVENGHTSNAKYSYLEHESVDIECNPRYSLPNELSNITCTEQDWSPPPRCIRVESCDMPIFENARPKSNGTRFKLNDELDYECREGYETSDGNTTGAIVCRDDGWSNPPTCLDPKEKCGRPPAIDNGELTSFPLKEYAPGMSVEYQCQAYYVLQGDMHVTCGNGQWSEPPKCLEACVISEDIMNEHNVELKLTNAKNRYFKTDDNIEFRCRSGYNPKTPESSFQTKCQEGTVIYPSCA
ncbi:complement factor H-related protein 3-like [Tamandua tetradactyla]|uniref:complement factor H-related protein 3-like n=1 Tax=Tamandua tetradactyla TaxID=48850 RepID=UPI0040547601